MDRETLARTPEIRQHGDEILGFANTAALSECMDLIITVDTSLAHLNGALGKKTWVLLAFDADWRWLSGRDDSPWYPTMRLFRQRTAGNWGELLGRVFAALRSEFSGRLDGDHVQTDRGAL